MKDEIKKIINDLQRVADRRCYPEDILDGSIAQEWVDYIINLQEENENLKIDNKRLQHNEKVFKSRNEKAREMIRFIAYNSERPLTITELNTVYYILGGDE